MSRDIVIRHCRGMAEMRGCVEVQRRVWGEADLEVIPGTCFIVAEHSGGQVLGAFVGSSIIAFTLATPAIRNGQAYLHSQMTAVLENYRDQAVGRRLKLFQREDALSRGIRMIEWTFDPLETRNAHFNLDILGAIARRIVRNMYGMTSSPLHRGLPTDRLVVDWHLDSERVVGILEGRMPAISNSAKDIRLPRNLGGLRTTSRDEIAHIQSRVSAEFEELFAEGYAVTSTRRSKEEFEYLLEVLPPGPDR